MVSSLTVRAEHDYPVLIGPGAVACLTDHCGPAKKFVLLHTESVHGVAHQVREMLGDAAHLVAVPDAEAGKTLSVAEQLWHTFGDRGISRQDAIIAVGGGAVTDLAGFVAATWMRGMRCVYIPTTVLGMVDAAVGGKTGINTAHGKNLVGAFASPAAVLCDTTTLATLPQADVAAGLAEVIKCGFIADPTIVALIQDARDAALDPSDPLLADLIRRAVAVKAEVVGQDFKEAFAREALNFGHTFGHAIETTSGFGWRHGDAVAVGMRYVLLVQQELGHQGADSLHEDLVDTLTAVGLPTHYNDQAPWDALYAAMGRDKKNRDGNIRFVTIAEMGRTSRVTGLVPEVLQAAFRRVVEPI